MNNLNKALATIIGATALSGASFFAGRESNKLEWQNPIFNAQSINSVHELVTYEGRRGLLLTGKILKVNFDSIVMMPEYEFKEEHKSGNRDCVLIPRGKMNDFVWEAIVGRAFTNNESIDIYSSNYGYGIAQADMVGKNNNVLYDLRIE